MFGFEKRLEYPAVFFRNLMEITMPNRAFSSCISLSAGLVLSGHFALETAILGAMAIITTYSSQAIYNNIKDIDGDKVNSSSRPLASGFFSVSSAWALMGLLIFLGICFAYLASPIVLMANMFGAGLGIVYSAYTKSRSLLSYITLVSTHLVLPLATGYLISQSLDLKLLLIVAFIYASEVLAFSIKDYKDVRGDRKMGMQTLPIILTPKKASLVTFAGFCIPPALVWIPWSYLGLSMAFLAIYLGTGVLRYFLGLMLLRNPSSAVGGEILKKFRYILMLQMLAWCLS
ncbi:MAG: UbiA family prenyltransferase [Candidatus Micrarchaeota archaeon]